MKCMDDVLTLRVYDDVCLMSPALFSAQTFRIIMLHSMLLEVSVQLLALEYTYGIYSRSSSQNSLPSFMRLAHISIAIRTCKSMKYFDDNRRSLAC